MPRSATAPSLADAMASQADAAAELLKVLGHPARLRILCLLVEGERSVGAINAEIPLSQSALSQHLALLRAEEIVTYRRDGQTLWYRVADKRIEGLLATLHRLYCQD